MRRTLMILLLEVIRFATDNVASPPDSQPPSRLRALWTERSRKGKVGIVAGVVLVALVVIGLAVPAEENQSSAPTATQRGASITATTAATEIATTTAESETTTEVAPPPLPIVTRVIDGDTLDLDTGDRIRLVQIDSPERKGECYGKKAGKVLRRLIPAGTGVRVVRDRKLDNMDKYGRLLRYVFKGKKNVNLVLVQKGAASVWFFQGDRGRYADKLLAAAKRASDARRGAWGACEAVLDPSGPFQTHPKENAPSTDTSQSPGCEPGYDPCLPITGDLDCADIAAMGLAPVTVTGADRYRLDGDNDGVGCE
jgi:endonuclease YncB( thermonuclease family)